MLWFPGLSDDVFFVRSISPSIICIIRWTLRSPILLLPTSECSCLIALETVTVKRCLRTELRTMTGVPLSPYFKILENRLVKMRLIIVLSLSRIPVTSGILTFVAIFLNTLKNIISRQPGHVRGFLLFGNKGVAEHLIRQFFNIGSFFQTPVQIICLLFRSSSKL